MKQLSILFTMFCLLSSCSYAIKDKDWQQTSKVVYRHSTPTITPEYYRSYSVTFTEVETVVEIRDYSKVLLTKRYPSTATQFKALVNNLQAMGVKKKKEVVSGAAGCESESLSLFKGESEYFSAYEACGDGNLEVKKGDLNVLVKELVPDLDKLINQTLNNVNEE